MSLMGWKVDFKNIDSGVSVRGVVVEQTDAFVTLANGVHFERIVLDPTITRHKKLSPELKDYMRHFCRNAPANFSFKDLLDDLEGRLGPNDKIMRRVLADYRVANNVLITKLPEVLMKNLLATAPPSNSDTRNPNDSDDGKTEDDDDEDEDHSDEDDEDDDDEDDEEDDDEEEEESEDDDDEDDSEDDDSSDDDSSDDDFFSVKVVQEVKRDARIVRVDDYKALVRKSLKEFGLDKAAPVRFFFVDEEGDRVLVSSKHSLSYARRAYAKQQRAAKAKGKQVLKLLMVADGTHSAAGLGDVSGVDVSSAVTLHQASHSSEAVLGAHRALDEEPPAVAPRTRMRGVVAGMGELGATHPESKEEGKFDDSLEFSPESTRARAEAKGEGTCGLAPIQLDAPSTRQRTGLTPSSSGSARTQTSTICWQRGEKIGSGSFGVVYSGIDLVAGGRIAVKEVRLAEGKRFKQQAVAMQREIKLLSELEHVNIIQYLGGRLCVSLCR
jgi:hypothetical protein